MVTNLYHNPTLLMQAKDLRRKDVEGTWGSNKGVGGQMFKWLCMMCHVKKIAKTTPVGLFQQPVEVISFVAY